ncbi:hypothetical protein BVG16_27065 [Paenibacillus selenitireducens]|uniref:NACHT domain-containing protein n=2 Tax=Paenibacillus selenitireducens TaxID=1324314 RepID=A0A1T2X1Y8_9BACL|nr:hypothetical protein BVG16_27065 [Paenibacillus selenitireducens]
MVKHAFASGNTAHGRVNFFKSAFQGARRIFLLEGAPGTGKSVWIRRIAEAVGERDIRTEWFHNPLDSETLDGLWIPAYGVGVIDATACQDAFDDVQDTEFVRISLESAVDVAVLLPFQEVLQALEDQIEAGYQRATDSFLHTLRIHDDWEKYYIEHIRFADADIVTDELKALIPEQSTGQGLARHLYLGAATWRGAVDYVMNLTEETNRRIYVKGRPGSGKSTMLKKLVQTAEERGVNVEVFHCGFDPNSLDMVVYPSLGLAIFDSTAPHEHFPNREGDEILDMYVRTIDQGTDERYADDILEVKTQYAASMKASIAILAEVKQLRDRQRLIYAAATDYTIVENIGQQLLEEVLMQFD